jgi:hypothetical protein
MATFTLTSLFDRVIYRVNLFLIQYATIVTASNRFFNEFDVHGSVHLGYVYVRLKFQLDVHRFICILYSPIFFVYVFRVLFAPETCKLKNTEQ